MLPGAKKGVPRLLDVNRQPSKPTKKRRPVSLVFDESKRKEFLTGFHKRKLQRRQKASNELNEKLKEEKKRIKQEARERFKNYVSQREVPELEELLSKQEYEADGKTVSILELNVNELSQGANWIGENKPVYEHDDSDTEEQSDDEDDPTSVPGMDLKIKKNKIIKKPDIEEKEKPRLDKKDINRAVKKETQKQTGRSKIFLVKQRLDRQKNKKMAKKVQFKQDRALKNAKGKAKKKLLKKMKKK